MALDEETKAEVMDAVKRVLSGRERVPGDLPFPPSIRDLMLATVWPEDDEEARRRRAFTKPGRLVARVTTRVYVAGWFAGRACDRQIGAQIRDAFNMPTDPAECSSHPYIGVAVCVVCDQPPDHDNHVVLRRQCTAGGMVAGTTGVPDG